MMDRRLLQILVLACIGLLFTAYPMVDATEREPTPTLTDTGPRTLTSHGQIVIDDDNDFTTMGFPGSGTEQEPYTIQGLEIHSIDGKPCIRVDGDVTSHYVIENCAVSGSRDVDDYGAIDLISGNGIVTDCDIYNSSTGIYVSGHGKSVELSHFWDCSYAAVRSSASYGLEISHNSFDVTGEFAIRISSCFDPIIDGNTFLGSIESGAPDYQVWVNNAPGIVFRNNNVSAVDHGASINSDNCTVSDNEFHIFAGSGLEMRQHSNMTVRRCVFYRASLVYPTTGLEIGASDNSSVIDCLSYGAKLSIYDSSNMIVRNCEVLSPTSSGISISEVYQQTHNLTLDNNTVLDSSSSGIFIKASSGVKAHGNTVRNCQTGIMVSKGKAHLHNNTVWFNKKGVYMGSETSNSRIYHNDIRNNTLNALDEGFNNVWDDNSSMGNIWDYYVTVNDRWPMIIEGDPPVIIVPQEVTMSLDTAEHNIFWNVSDVTPDRYEFYVNGTLVASGAWDGQDLLFNMSASIEVGVYNVTLVLYDANGNSASESIMVIVTDEPTVDPMMMSQSAAVLSVVTIGIVVIVLKRNSGE